MYPVVGHVVAGWHLRVSTLQTHRNEALFFFLFLCLSGLALACSSPLFSILPFLKQGTVSLGEMIYLWRCVNRGNAKHGGCSYSLRVVWLVPGPQSRGQMTPLWMGVAVSRVG